MNDHSWMTKLIMFVWYEVYYFLKEEASNENNNDDLFHKSPRLASSATSTHSEL